MESKLAAYGWGTCQGWASPLFYHPSLGDIRLVLFVVLRIEVKSVRLVCELFPWKEIKSLELE